MNDIDLSNLNLSDKEEKILKSAIMIFSEKGFSASTTKEIAKNAGVAEGTIFKYYKTKKDILSEIIIQMIKVISKNVILGPIEKIILDENEKNIKVIFKKIFFDRLKLLDTFFPMAKVAFTEALMNEEVRDAIYENIILKALDLFKEFHLRMVEKGLFRNDIEPEVIFRCIFANIGILIMQKKLFGDKLKIDEKMLDEELDKTFDIIFYGVTKKAGDKL
jgi:AcrR family transcriptional regulator